MDIAFGEQTPHEKYEEANARLAAITPADKLAIRHALMQQCERETETFMSRLKMVLDRIVKRIVLIPLFGNAHEYSGVEDAVAGLDGIDKLVATGELCKIEVIVDYSNGDTIRASFGSSKNVSDFLRGLG